MSFFRSLVVAQSPRLTSEVWRQHLAQFLGAAAGRRPGGLVNLGGLGREETPTPRRTADQSCADERAEICPQSCASYPQGGLPGGLREVVVGGMHCAPTLSFLTETAGRPKARLGNQPGLHMS